MATDVQRQAKTDEIYDKLVELKALADEAIAMDLVAQLPVGRCTLRLDEMNPDDLKTYLSKIFESES